MSARMNPARKMPPATAPLTALEVGILVLASYDPFEPRQRLEDQAVVRLAKRGLLEDRAGWRTSGRGDLVVAGLTTHLHA